MNVDARTEQFEKVELLGKPALFTNYRIDRTTVPDRAFCYDLRGSDRDPGRPVTVEPNVTVNHAGTVITAEPVDFKGEGYRYLRRDGLNFLGGESSLTEYLAEQNELPTESIQMGGMSQ